jgi:PAS domain S-box-containing protein
MDKQSETYASFEAVPDALLLVSRDGLIVFANQHAERLFGYEPGQLVGLQIEALIPEQYRQRHAELRAEFAVDPAARPMGVGRELRALRSDGQKFPVEVGIGPTDGGERVVAVVRDITSVQETRDGLRDSEAESRDLGQSFANAPIGLCVYDRELRYVRINKWLAELNGVPVKQHIGQTIADVLPDAAIELEPQLRRVLRTGEPILGGLVEATTPAHPTTTRTYMYNYFPERSAAGAVVGISCVVHDVTEATKTLTDALAEIEELRDRLQAENVYFQEEIKSSHDFDDIIGSGAAMMATLHKLEQVAETDATVLLLGETGTGKELLARAIHSRSKRSMRPLIKVDCTTLPPGLMESDLFGHQKGAFTGAHESKPGRFELADGGTIFLDEIGELPIDLQGKLLRVLQEGEFQRLGSQQERHVDVRIIAATNRDLRREMLEGRFRSDLYYRLFFVSQRSKALGKRVESVPRAAMNALTAYDWPGNIRELQNVLERALILSPGRELVFSEELSRTEPRPRGVEGARNRNLKEIEAREIRETLEETGWKVKGEGNAASRLGLKPGTLRSRMKKLGITRP